MDPHGIALKRCSCNAGANRLLYRLLNDIPAFFFRVAEGACKVFFQHGTPITAAHLGGEDNIRLDVQHLTVALEYRNFQIIGEVNRKRLRIYYIDAAGMGHGEESFPELNARFQSLTVSERALQLAVQLQVDFAPS